LMIHIFLCDFLLFLLLVLDLGLDIDFN
jgi:hypothetical protein